MDQFTVMVTFSLLCGLPMEYEAVRYIDLSYEYDKTTLFWSPENKYKMTVLNNGTTDGGFWYQAEAFSMATHGGTHLDAPCHFFKDGWSVEQIPLNRLISPGVVVDVSQKTLNNPDYQVSIEDLEEWERQHGKLPQGVVLLIRTGWSKYWPNKLKYFGTNSSDSSNYRFPGLSAEVSQWIATYRNISGIGVDTPSIDYGQSSAYDAHRTLAAKNIYNLENVAEMGDLSATGFTLYVMPVKLKDASGAPCRIFAALPDPSNKANTAAIVEYSEL